ncbi:uncharacterized protein DUF2809 [Salana multivorans]|uniref:Uncharacterized protein DUF2809 n=1 Tax=Salana multivorans TaxID=120377 RepID=A0A3N2DD41_9MICO|nr:DUF2809 domain-containing protein [Salana multivorans]MBN8882378.1 DUF2809 domain-containing protein [Salana multivorans]OJX98043.1 MAG: hypothetical protein BGO96_14305 [Micrococcales bacterium 73-15]ROR97693.1 uncharacterized protein DUF2809 [Salana multivorans]
MSASAEPGPAGTRVRRWTAAAVVVLLVPLGLAVRLLPGLVGDLAGGVAYAAMVYALLVAILPRVRRASIACAALALVLGIELLQLTGVPTAVVGAFPPARYVLGSTFAWLDLVSAAAGVAVASGVDALAARRAAAAPTTRTRPGRG